MSNSEADLQALFDFTFPFAKQQLRKRGSLAPFGAVMRTDGEVVPVAADPGPEPSETVSVRAVQLLKAGMVDGARKGELRTTMLLYESVFRGDPSKPSDAITVCGDHRDGSSTIVIFCFELGPPKSDGGRDYTPGKEFEMDGKREIFVG